MSIPIVLDGHSLTPAALRSIADGARVSIDGAATAQMERGRHVVDRYFRDAIPAYGLTTGLGMRADQMLTPEAAAGFSYRMVRGRAQALGEPLRADAVRAVMAVRLNTLLSGAAGASAEVATALLSALNNGLVPVMPGIGSIGAGDLVVMAALPLALIGEGEMLVDGGPRPAAEVLASAGVAPLALLPKDGAVLCNSTAFSTALGALAAHDAANVLDALHVAGALSMEGFRGNLSPFSPGALLIRPQHGQVEAGARIADLLRGGPLDAPGAARRLQDPLSFRCMPQVFGAALAALGDLDDELRVDLNHSPDNPVVLIDEGLCVSTGNFHLPRLTQTLDSAARALAWCATDSVSRVQRLMHGPHSGLAPLLSSDSPDTAGFGPLLKPAEALRAQITHLANPVPVMASHNADGIEDSATFSALAAFKLGQLVDPLSLLVAFEMVAACQAIDLRSPGGDPPLAPALLPTFEAVRALCSFIDEDRPVGRQIEAVARYVVRGDRPQA